MHKMQWTIKSERHRIGMKNAEIRRNAMKTALPRTKANGYYEIRLESIGGLGANLCGKLLGELGAVYLRLNAASFSSYGSEKRGSPVKAFIRWCEEGTEIRTSSPVAEPDLLCLFHEAIAGKKGVLSGVTECTKLVINTDVSPEVIRDRLRLYAGDVCCVDALTIALETKSKINTVLLGAMAKASGFIPIDAVIAVVRDTIGKKYPSLLQNNIEGIQRGYEEVTIRHFDPDGRYEKVEYGEIKSAWGYETAPIGGVNPCCGSTVTNELSSSREGFLPLYREELCIHCALCDSTCPDMVFQFTKGIYKGREMMMNRGLDYHHCKGCLRCVEVCPTHALIKGVEREQQELKWFVRNKDLIVRHLEFEDAGANSWVTSESYMDEKSVDGGMTS